MKFLSGLVLGFLTIGLISWLLAGFWQMALAIENSDIEITQDDQYLIIVIYNPQDEDLRWQYGQNIPAGNCNENLTDELTEIDENLTDMEQFPWLISVSADTYCFKITNVDNDQSAWYAYQIERNIDEQGPVIDPRRSRNDLLVISSSDQDLDISSWQYASFGHDIDCAMEIIDNPLPARTSNSLALRELDNNRWYCFKARDVSGNATLEKYKVEGVDTTAPEIVIRQDGRLLTASLTETETVDWDHVLSPSDVNCDEGTFRNNISKVTGNRVTLTTDSNNYYYCFRAKDSGGNFGYAKYKVESVDFLTPKISLEKTNLLIKAMSDRSIKNWYYLKTDASIGCNAETDFETAIDFSNTPEIELTEEDHKRYFCVKGVSSTNQASFARIQVDTHIPKVKLKVTEKLISASADKENLDWEYLRIEDELDCSQNDSERFAKVSDDKYQGQKSQLSELDNGFWFCFRARDNNGNSGYAKKQINDITAKPPGSSSTSSRGQTDILIITIIAIGGGVGFIIYTLIKKKREVMVDDYLNPTNETVIDKDKSLFGKQKNKKKIQDDAEEEIIQPLDYLKKNKDE